MMSDCKTQKNMINIETQKHDKYEKWEMLNNVIFFIIKNEQTEPNSIHRFYLLLKTSKLNLTLFIAFIYY